MLFNKGQPLTMARIAPHGVCQWLGAIPDRREDKERKAVDKTHCTRTLLALSKPCFDLPTGEGAPQGLRGWGVRLRGSGEEFPSGFGQSPRSCFLPCMAWIGGAEKPRRALCILLRSDKIRIGLRLLTNIVAIYARLSLSIILGVVVILYVGFYLIQSISQKQYGT